MLEIDKAAAADVTCILLSGNVCKLRFFAHFSLALPKLKFERGSRHPSKKAQAGIIDQICMACVKKDG